MNPVIIQHNEDGSKIVKAYPDSEIQQVIAYEHDPKLREKSGWYVVLSIGPTLLDRVDWRKTEERIWLNDYTVEILGLTNPYK